MSFRIESTSSCVTGLKERRGVPVNAGSCVMLVVVILSRLSLMFCTLEVKKEEKAEGSSEGGIEVGRGVDLAEPRRFDIVEYNCFVVVDWLT